MQPISHGSALFSSARSLQRPETATAVVDQTSLGGHSCRFMFDESLTRAPAEISYVQYIPWLISMDSASLKMM